MHNLPRPHVALLGLALLILPAASVLADTTPPETKTVALTATDWSQNLVFAKFDPSLGTLSRIDFSLEGNVTGTASFENRSASATIIGMQLKADLVLTRPDASVLITTIPISNTSDAVSGYDGTLDFGGTSGKSYNNLSASLTNASFSISSGDLSLFTGPGSITLPITAKGTSTASGSGNLITSFTTSASGIATIFYTFTPTAVPEPSSIVLTVIGGLALWGTARRRAAKRAGLD